MSRENKNIYLHIMFTAMEANKGSNETSKMRKWFKKCNTLLFLYLFYCRVFFKKYYHFLSLFEKMESDAKKTELLIHFYFYYKQ